MKRSKTERKRSNTRCCHQCGPLDRHLQGRVGRSTSLRQGRLNSGRMRLQFGREKLFLTYQVTFVPRPLVLDPGAGGEES
jgi:hypothetical protein